MKDRLRIGDLSGLDIHWRFAGLGGVPLKRGADFRPVVQAVLCSLPACGPPGWDVAP